MASLMARLRRWAAPDAEVEESELRTSAASEGCTDVGRCHAGDQAVVLGIVRSITVEPSSGLPRLEAVISDGTGSMRLVWLGRRRIRGIEPGRRLRVAGRVNASQEELVLYNPRYALLPGS